MASGLVIDLCTPPPSPQRASSGGGGCIDLCTPPSSPTPHDAPAAAAPAAAAPAAAAPAGSKRPLSTAALSTAPVKLQRPEAGPSSSADAGPSLVEDEEEVLETAAPPAPNKDVRMGGEADENEDIQCTGRTGDNALMDFPHARENCVAVKFVQGQESKCCENCYCYVCDAPAKECPEWADNHCKASHLSAAWQQRRKQWKSRQAAAAAAKAGGGPAGLQPATAGAPSKQPRKREVKGWSCDAFYRALLQVYPKEEPQPAGLLSSITLRPYQKQSLAFMIDLERSTQPETAGRVGGRTVRGGWLCDEMGMGKTAVVTALCLANPPGPAPGGKAAVGGSGSGSGSTTLKLTLVIVSNTLVKQWEDEVKRFAPSLRVHSLYQGAGEGRAAALANLGQVDVLITTPHAKWPAELCSDTATKHIHRLIVDESHLLGGKSWKAQQVKLLRVPANHTWCVTGTPFSAGLPDLDYQARLLGHWSDGMHLSVKIKGVTKVSEMTKAQLAEYTAFRGVKSVWTAAGSLATVGMLSSEELVAELRTLMIRHVKAQRIGGEVALALPDASSETVWLQMSADEKLLYGLHACYDGKPEWSKLVTLSKKDLHRLDELERGLTRRRDATCHAYSAKAVAAGGNIEGSTDPARAAACAAFLRMHTKGTPATDRIGEIDEDSKWKVKPEACTKYQALLDDMATLRQRERQCKVVVFTSRSRVQQELVELVKASPKAGASTWTIFEFNRDTPPLRRHRLIHDFQHGSTDKPCVFIVTYETAAVGITLTAATRVYLMEPAIDPAQEAQAAGRIHRLGQTKEIHIKRFAFKDSIDEAIAALHDKIKSGAVKLVDREFPPEALQHFVDHGVARPHTVDPDASGATERMRPRDVDKCQRKIGLGYDDGSPAPLGVSVYTGLPPGVAKPAKHGFTYKEAPCACCGRTEKVEGSLVWFGTGNMRWLHGITGMVADHPKDPHRATHVEHPKRPLTATAAAQLAGNDPLNDGARKADLCRIGLMEAANKVKQAEEKVRKREVRLAELEERVKELEELAKLAQGSKQESLAHLGITGSTKSEKPSEDRAAEVAQDRAGQERVALELAKRELEQAKIEKQRLSVAGPSTADPLLMR